MGLFDTPDQIRQAQQAQLMQQYRAGDMVGAAAAGLGNTLAKAAGYGLFDIDPRSKEEIQAQKQQELLKRTDFSDFDSVMSASKGLQKINPEASLRLVSHAREKLNTTTTTNKWTKKDGRWFVRGTTSDKLGNSNEAYSNGFDSAQRILDVAKQRAVASRVGSRDPHLGQVEIGGTMVPVFNDLSGGAYIKDPSKVTPDNPEGRDYQAAVNNGAIVKSTEDVVRAGGRQQQARNETLAMQALRRNAKSKALFNWKIFDGLSDEAQLNMSLQIASKAENMFRDKSTKELYNNNIGVLIDQLAREAMKNYEITGSTEGALTSEGGNELWFGLDSTQKQEALGILTRDPSEDNKKLFFSRFGFLPEDL